ncbi:hypothetical protein HDU82_000073 [Entophlyctis luteolus]|nr:hypothetical protein HDU82_000073 [Entophlyctis luteolus]
MSSPAKPATARRRICIISISAAVVVVVVIAVTVGVVVSRNNSGSVSSPASSSGSGTESPSNGTSGGGSTNHKLYGYYGTNTVANGVDLMKGYDPLNGNNPQRITPTSDYQRDLKHYWYYDYLSFAFLNQFGSVDFAAGYWKIQFGSFGVSDYVTGVYEYDGTSVTSSSDTAGFAKLGLDVSYCQSKGIKIIISLGGDNYSPYGFGTGDGVLYANLWYNQFFGGNSTVRPFGPGVKLDGIELDIEKTGTGWTSEMVDFVTTLKGLDSSILIAAVPQCALYSSNGGIDANTGPLIQQVGSKGLLDYIIIQYYNNPGCSYPFGFNYFTWKTLFPGPIYVGLAADWTAAIAGGFLEYGPLQAVYDMVKNDSQFAGFSVYDVSASNPPAYYWTVETYSDPQPSNYSAVLRSVLDGHIVGSGYPPQGPVVDDGSANVTYRCGGTWIWAQEHCSLTDCKAALEACTLDHCPDRVCNGGEVGLIHCNQMISGKIFAFTSHRLHNYQYGPMGGSSSKSVRDSSSLAGSTPRSSTHVVGLAPVDPLPPVLPASPQPEDTHDTANADAWSEVQSPAMESPPVIEVLAASELRISFDEEAARHWTPADFETNTRLYNNVENSTYLIPVDGAELSRIEFNHYLLRHAFKTVAHRDESVEDNSFDYIHQRQVLVSGVQANRYGSVIAELIRVAKPGAWIELIELDGIAHNAGPKAELLNKALQLAMESRGHDLLGGTSLFSHVRAQKLASLIDVKSVSVPLNWGNGSVGKRHSFVTKQALVAMGDWLHKALGKTREEYITLLDDIMDEHGETKAFVNYHCVSFQVRIDK